MNYVTLLLDHRFSLIILWTNNLHVYKLHPVDKCSKYDTNIDRGWGIDYIRPKGANIINVARKHNHYLFYYMKKQTKT